MYFLQNFYNTLYAPPDRIGLNMVIILFSTQTNAKKKFLIFISCHQFVVFKKVLHVFLNKLGISIFQFTQVIVLPI